MATIGDVLTEDSDSTGQRVLALDEYHVHYAMTRDNSVNFAYGTVSRFSCKDCFGYEELKSVDPEAYGKQKILLPQYRTWVVGQVRSIEKVSRHRILPDTKTARQGLHDCYVVTLRCPLTANKQSREFFDKQIVALETIITTAGTSSYGSVLEIDGWLGPMVDGKDTIQITVEPEKMDTWRRGWWTFNTDQYVKMLVRLTRDDGVNGGLREIYAAWLEEFEVLADEELVGDDDDCPP